MTTQPRARERLDHLSYTTSRDTTATATGVLGVIWIRQTLLATKDTARAAIEANRTTREIGEAQTRAYLNCVGASYTVVNQLCVIKVNIRNYGLSPSPHATLSGSMVVPNLHSVTPFDGLLRTETKTAEMFSVPAGGDTDAMLVIQISFPTKVRQELFEGDWLVSADCVLEWVDVFNNTQIVSFFLLENDRAFERDENLPPRRVGSMKASNIRPDQRRPR